MSSTFLKGTAWMSISSFLFLALGYVAQILIGRSLTPSEYGTFGVAVYILNIVEFVVITGLGQSLSKFIAEQPKAGWNVVRHSVLAQLVLALLVSIPLAVFASAIAGWFGDQSMAPLLRVVALILPFYSVRGLLQGILSGQREFSSASKVTITIGVIKFGLICTALALHLSPMAILGAYLIGSLAGAIVGWQFVKPLDRSTQVPAAAFYRYALSLTIFLIVFPLFINLDVFLVKRFLPSGDDAGVYVAASTLGRMPFYLFTGLLLTLLPTVAHLKETAFERLQQIVREVNRYTLLLLLPTVALILATANSLMPLLFSSSYSNGGNILRLLIVGMSMLVLFRIATTVLAGITNPAQVVGMTGVMILVNLLLNLLFIPRFGMLGAALASVLSSALGLILAVIQLRRYKLLVLDRPSLQRAILASLIVGALCIVHPSNILLLPLLIVAGILYLGLLFRFREFETKDRDRIRSLFRRERSIS